MSKTSIFKTKRAIFLCHYLSISINFLNYNYLYTTIHKKRIEIEKSHTIKFLIIKHGLNDKIKVMKTLRYLQ